MVQHLFFQVIGLLTVATTKLHIHCRTIRIETQEVRESPLCRFVLLGRRVVTDRCRSATTEVLAGKMPLAASTRRLPVDIITTSYSVLHRSKGYTASSDTVSIIAIKWRFSTIFLSIMAPLWNRAGHYIFALWFLSSSFLWPPYEIGPATIYLPCGFFLSIFYLSFFLA